ncbi:MAG: SRPBCC domain-containing protein [Polyangiaceae bacterium]
MKTNTNEASTHPSAPAITSCEANFRVGISATPDAVYEALTDTKKLAAWWTSDTRGDGTRVGGRLEFWFGTFCQKFEVKALDRGKRVVWKATEEGMEEWVPTEVSFTLTTKEATTIVNFTHGGWAARSDFFVHCSTKWVTFLLSLKALLETGEGRPAPHDLKIGD